MTEGAYENHLSIRRTRHSYPLKFRKDLMILPFLLINLLNSKLVDASYAVSIDPGDEECFTFMTPKDLNSFSKFTGSFEVLHDDVDAYEIGVTVADYNTGESIHGIPPGEQWGEFTLKDLKPASKYSICFQNTASPEDEENEFDVGFNVRFHDAPRSLEEGEIGPDGERAMRLVEHAAAIHEDWDVLQDHFEFLRNRDGIHLGMNNEIMSRLAQWTYIEALLVVGMAVGQVMYWKKFFEKRRYL